MHRAFDTILHREVALKLLPPAGAEESERLLDEARRLARVRHPQVITVHGADIHDGQVGIWCDLLRGRTLQECIDRDSPWLAERIVALGRDLAQAIGAIHEAGLLHGDVKPSNVFVETSGRVVLFDLGSGRRRDEDARVPITGTPSFLPPEAFADGDPSANWDLYGLGVLLYRVSAGAFPRPATSYRELRFRHASGPPPSLRLARPDLSTRFTAVVDRMLEPAPERRFRSAEEVERALEDCLEQAQRHAVLLAHDEREAERRGNLPTPERLFVGRARELSAVGEALALHRCVTLAGIGGCGKTRLALEVARRLADRFDGAWFVDLSRISEPERVAFLTEDVDVANVLPQVEVTIECVHEVESSLPDQRIHLVLRLRDDVPVDPNGQNQVSSSRGESGSSPRCANALPEHRCGWVLDLRR